MAPDPGPGDPDDDPGEMLGEQEEERQEEVGAVGQQAVGGPVPERCGQGKPKLLLTDEELQILRQVCFAQNLTKGVWNIPFLLISLFYF